jgi:hypothetical protein
VKLVDVQVKMVVHVLNLDHNSNEIDRILLNWFVKS